jgi:hypothetical protein
MHNQIHHVPTDRRRYSCIFDVLSFRWADCDTNHYLVVAKVMKRLTVSKQVFKKMDMETFNLKKLKEDKLNNSIWLQSKTSLQVWKT